MALKDTITFLKVTIIAIQVVGSTVCRATACKSTYLRSLIVSLVGFGTNYLIDFKTGPNKIYAGLWKLCGVGGSQSSKCADLTDPQVANYFDEKVWLKASRVMTSIALVIHFLDILGTICTLIINNISIMSIRVLAVLEFVAAFSGIIGVAVACGNLKGKMEDKLSVDFSVGWSFVLFLVAQFAFVGAGLLHLLDARLKLTRRPPPHSSYPTVSTVSGPSV